ncbi:hypothetical protein BJ138DRAFT_1169765 [Hygrophoropsis aurantiaca]|uniref:Uncharacterized protein n=1 Tax=Hygrophoropsis aurantiaca TaxID=72124 RepID=A0ACB8AR92_9AGAM|nr:hypothetical protein BJ138DRAFT_1169765 [Hygrophoropsis aurantiaca]
MFSFIIQMALFMLLLCHENAANTEIINFMATEEPKVALPSVLVGNWTTLHYAHNERQWTLQPALIDTNLKQVCEPDYDSVSPENSPFLCPHEVWVTLNLDDQSWRAYSRFTLRLSWPASSPADYQIDIHTPKSLSTYLSRWQNNWTHHNAFFGTADVSHSSSTVTRQKYARIRVVDTGVFTPAPHLQSQDYVVKPVSFIIILEQLYLGFLPASFLPTVCFLVPVLLAAAMIAPYLIRYLDRFVRQAREELEQSRALLEKKR